MSNDLYHNESGVSSLASGILNKIKQYEKIVDDLESLVVTISSSNDWIDMAVKTAFVEKCNEYIGKYRGCISTLDSYISGYLTGKSNEIAGIERAYS